MPSGPVRHWSAGPGPTPLLRGSTAAATLGAGSALDSSSNGDGLYGNSDAESLDAEEAREMMAAMTLDLRKVGCCTNGPQETGYQRVGAARGPPLTADGGGERGRASQPLASRA